MNETDAAGAGAGIVMIIYLAIFLVTIIGCWKAYSKAGQPGWACIIPIYNAIVWLQICGRPIWWFILLLIPLVNLIILIIICIDFAKSFGKGVGFGLGIFFLGFIFIPILGFGSASYQGPAVKSA
jgi:hypothetical protein